MFKRNIYKESIIRDNMVWPFKKQKEDLDLTLLAKRGLLKAPAQPSDVDLTQPVPSNTDSGIGFLGAMASSAESPASSSPSSPTGGNKIDDIEYKLDALTRRINSMVDRIDLMEKKVDRLERHEI
jgi:hypothetical protein